MDSHDVFISYASKDVQLAKLVCRILEEHGISCWIAPRDISLGVKYGEAIIEAIRTSRVFVFIFTAHSNLSEHTVREIERAANYGLEIIPLRIASIKPSAAIEYFIAGMQWLDATDGPLVQFMPTLVRSVNYCLSGKALAESSDSGILNSLTPIAPTMRTENFPIPEKKGELNTSETDTRASGAFGRSDGKVCENNNATHGGKCEPPSSPPMAKSSSPFGLILPPQLFQQTGNRLPGVDKRMLRPWLLLTLVILVMGFATFLVHSVLSSRLVPTREKFDLAGPLPSRSTTSTTSTVPDAEVASITTLANRGLQYLRTGNFRAAADDFTQAIHLNAKSLQLSDQRLSQLHAFRAQAYDQLQDTEAAIREWDRSIALDPDDFEGYSIRGQMFLRLQNVNRALTDFRKVVELEPSLWLGYELIGDVYRIRNEPQEVIRYYQMALERKPRDPAALHQLVGNAARQMNNHELAKRHWQAAKSLDSNIDNRFPPP